MMLLIVLVMEGSNIDRDVSRWFYSAETRSFPWRHEFLFDTVLHHWAKYAVILVTGLAAAMTSLTWIVPRLRPRRAQLLFVVLAMTLAPATVTAMKLVTDRPCPWDLVDFGGNARYTRLFQPRNFPHAPGQCFPAGHASTGFALMAFYFAAFRERRYALARTMLPVGVVAGLLLGVSRIAQGAHFLSHVLWAGLICWMVMLLLHVAIPAGAHAESNAENM